jgi:hypothetical protein
MALIPEIDKLLACDEENVRETRRFLSESSHDLPEALNQAAVLYSTANRSFGQGLADHFRELAAEIDALGVNTIDELEAKLETPAPTGQEAAYVQALDVLNRYYDREYRGILLVRLGILYATAVADLLRMRVTGPLGYVRVQCESLALMNLMRTNPALAREWRHLLTEADGKAFYKNHQQAVKAELRTFDLEFAYDNASSTALHSRFSGATLGLEVSSQVIDGKIIQEVKVKAQELDPDNPDLFLLIVLHVLRVQDRILRHLRTACPEINDRLLIETRIPAFARAVDALYTEFGRRRLDLVERYRTEVAGAGGKP